MLPFAMDSSTPPQEVFAGKTKEGDYKQQKLINDFYNHHVCIGATAIQELDSPHKDNINQIDGTMNANSVTASGMREICHQQPTASCTAFVKRKFSCSRSIYYRSLLV